MKTITMEIDVEMSGIYIVRLNCDYRQGQDDIIWQIMSVYITSNNIWLDRSSLPETTLEILIETLGNEFYTAKILELCKESVCKMIDSSVAVN